MNRSLQKVVIFLLVPYIFCFSIQAAGCREKAQSHCSRLKIMNWNTQTFFDSQKTGTEYKDFVKSDWNKTMYKERVTRLCETIRTLDADICILEEIENKDIISDIFNCLAENTWNIKKIYRYGCFSREDNAAIGCAVISRLPLEKMTLHTIDIRTETAPQPPVRSLMEITVNTGNCFLTIMVNHWKSKSGGKEETEIWRDWEESVLTHRIVHILQQKETAAVIAAGDFNRTIEDFIFCGTDGKQSSAVLLRGAGFGNILTVPVSTPWINADGSTVLPGSYYFRGKWERIDNFFSAGHIHILEFTPETNGPWADENGIPVKYEIRKDSGYSDHLPISCRIELQ